MRSRLHDLVITALFAALLVAVQVALAALPNIELVSLFIILFTLVYKHRVFYAIYVFALLQGLIYGFTLWWICYLYIWTLLAFVTMLCKNVRSPLLWAVISGGFGLAFGLISEIPFVFVIGVPAAVAAWVSGIPFDLAHCVGNFALALLLFKPLYTALYMLKNGQKPPQPEQVKQ